MKKRVLIIFILLILVPSILASVEESPITELKDTEMVNNLSIQGNVYLVDSLSINYDFSHLDKAKIKIRLLNNESYETFSNEEGKFEFNLNTESEIITNLEIYLDDCLIFLDESSKQIQEGLGMDVSIFDISH